MKKLLLLGTALAVTALSAFAIDGQVLINQSTVMASGGFPYTITQPGSYKLTGNLLPPTSTSAIYINAPNVTLDLNGFVVSCTFSSLPFEAQGCIWDAGMNTNATAIVIRNGVVSANITYMPGPSLGLPYAINFSHSGPTIAEDLRITGNAQGIWLPASSALRRSSLGNLAACKSLIEYNVLSFAGTVQLPACGNVLVGNVGIQ
jgi:hypothetical protein